MPGKEIIAPEILAYQKISFVSQKFSLCEKFLPKMQFGTNSSLTKNYLSRSRK